MNKYPLTMKNDHMFLELQSGLWLIDTGAPTSFGSESTASIEKTDFEIQSNYMGMDINQIKDATDIDMVGLLGIDVLNNFDFLLDLPSETATISSDEIEHQVGFLPKIPIHEDVKHFKPFVTNAVLDIFSLTESSIEENLLIRMTYSLFDQSPFNDLVYNEDDAIEIDEEMIFNKIEQVIGNLISNAIKWTNAGGSITLSCLDKPESTEIKVIDNGRGISEENLPHIFERFFKIDSSRADEGTGLGLSISRHIIELHGGEITAESEENVGSEFTIVLSKNNSN